jgi:hypothetical protein
VIILKIIIFSFSAFAIEPPIKPPIKGLKGTAKKWITGIGIKINIKITEVRAPFSICFALIL